MIYNKRHGGPYDRGNADKYYCRSFNPHYFKGATYMSERVGLGEMTAEEITAYTAGYRDGWPKFEKGFINENCDSC